ncbi:unnamed protein product [Acanthoscelides obtectus]|uniref:Reverse transcriptase domain-containing protein n=1 Tax=Acanthoscelides obtectus TaxID=200917 RepID=A0A9P0P6A1_ACAOB|nr:unnamed protein product [Acanthoscelides obtectus]CAK1669295.1 RNA-directed DNA polymerase from mobile element jockey [Acanthoscelides obtectus]
MKTMWETVRKNKNTSTGMNTSKEPNEFNDLFCTITNKLLENLDAGELHPESNIVPPMRHFNFEKVSFNDVRDAINSLKRKNSKDIYDMSTLLIKMIKNQIVMPLTKLINICIECGIFPDCLRRAVFTNGDTDNIASYRPISLLMVLHFETDNMFYLNQFGFRSQKNTTFAVLELVDDIIDAFEEKEFLQTIFCDLSKTFDCVSHTILIRKLRMYNSFLRPNQYVFKTELKRQMKSILNTVAL